MDKKFKYKVGDKVHDYKGQRLLITQLDTSSNKKESEPYYAQVYDSTCGEWYSQDDLGRGWKAKKIKL